MKILLFGATGTAGTGVLRASLASTVVGEVRVIARRPPPVAHPKLVVRIHSDFSDYSAVSDVFAGVDACFFCLGISATQVKEEAAYRVITRDYAMAAARELTSRSPNATFHYLSARGASLTSGLMWARVKAEAERDLTTVTKPVCWRPAFIDGEVKSGPVGFRLLRPFFRLFRPFKSLYVVGDDIGKAMILVTTRKERGRVVHSREIRELADQVQNLVVR